MQKKMRLVKIQQELIEEAKKEVEKSQYKDLSEFVSDAIRLRLQALAKERVTEYLEQDIRSRVSQLQAQLLYTPKHVWAKMTSQGNVRLGMTDYLQDQLKEVVNIQTDEVGERVSKNEPFGMVETWWFTHDLYSPLNGKIVSVNNAVIDDPFRLNADSYQWIIEVQPEHSEIQSWKYGLLSSEDYKTLVTEPEGGTTEERVTYETKKMSETSKPKLESVRIKRELVEVAQRTLDRGSHSNLSELVSEAVQLRLEELKQSHRRIVEKQLEYPIAHERLLYTSNHVWAVATPEANVRVGLSDYAQERLKGIGAIYTHPIDHDVKKGEPFGVVETWMFMFDLYSPVSGKIVKINKALLDEPFLIDDDPHNIFWIAEIKPYSLVKLEEELRDLMGMASYRTHVNQIHRSRILGI